MTKPNSGSLTGVGYEGLDSDGFCRLLVKNKIEVVCDVRKNAISRKRGFSKNKLKEALAAVGIEYVHLPTLGIPSETRQKAKTERAWQKMLHNYEASLSSPDWDPILRLVLAEKKRVALLCFEKEADCCHRTRLAHRIETSHPEVKVMEIPRGA
ncbi:MAG: DUF488 domain-containing protein [Proteobacteria bacterium]|nr:MAG: DUF488 domain-containing protein [Pseudomonadota bacterium]